MIPTRRTSTSSLPRGNLVSTPPSPVTFTQTNTTTATTVPAAVDIGTLNPADIPSIITAIGTLQSAVNTNRHLLNSIIDILQDADLAD